MTALQATSEARGALTRAAAWRLLGLLFERPREGWWEEVSSLASEVDEAQLRQAAVEARRAEEGSYLAALGPGGQVSPREVGYRFMGDPGKLLAEVVGFYQAFAYHPRAEDPADHVAVEAGFVGYLALKEAFALAGGDGAAAAVARRARERFLSEHLGSFAAELARRLETAPPHLARAGRWLAEAAGSPDPPAARGAQRGMVS